MARVPTAVAAPVWRWTVAAGAATVCLLAVLALLLRPAVADDACHTAASDRHDIDRVAGGDRFATAACGSRTAYPDPDVVDHVLIARGDAGGGLADALAGAVLAHAVDGPVLLTLPDALPDATRDEVERLAPSRATVLGGTAAVADDVAAEIAEHVEDVGRLAGGSRADTAAQVSAAAGAQGTAFVVNGFRPADALVAAAPAARAGAALLQVHDGGVPDATRDALATFDEVVIVGGHGVVDAEHATSLRELATDVRRVGGGDRAETAASLARAFPATGRIHLASGDDDHLVDAVTAGWAAAMPGGGPVLYSGLDAPLTGSDRWLRLGGLAGAGDADGSGNAETVATLRLVGGDQVLSDELVAVLENRLDESAAGGPPDEIRALWVHLFDDTLRDRGQLHAMLDDVVRSGGNTVIAQVSRRQDAVWTSDVLPRLPERDLPGDLDVLEELIGAAHARGLQVHAWSSVLPAYHPDYDDLYLDDDHVWVRHGPGSDEPWVSEDVSGSPGVFLDPGVPAVQEHVVVPLAEIAADYDVDALHIDYLRYDHGNIGLADDDHSGVTGYNEVALQRYADRHGTDQRPEPDDEQWLAFRREQTRDLMRRIRVEVADADPSVAVSQAGVTWGGGPDEWGGLEQTPTYRWVLQDWPRWLVEGAIDVAFPMNYYPEDTQAAYFDGWVEWQAGLEHDGHLAVGQGAFLNPVDDSLAQLTRVRGQADGAAIYSYQGQDADGGDGALVRPLGKGLWSQPAAAPDLVGAPERGHLVVSVEDGLGVEVETAGGALAVERADATGRAVFLHLDPGTVRVEADGHGSRTVEIKAGDVQRVTLE